MSAESAENRKAYSGRHAPLQYLVIDVFEASKSHLEALLQAYTDCITSWPTLFILQSISCVNQVFILNIYTAASRPYCVSAIWAKADDISEFLWTRLTFSCSNIHLFHRPPLISSTSIYSTIMADHSRDPCPWVTLSDFGGAFAMGVSSWFYPIPPPMHRDQYTQHDKMRTVFGTNRMNIT